MVWKELTLSEEKIQSGDEDLEYSKTIVKEKDDKGQETGNFIVQVNITNPWDYTWIAKNVLEEIDGKKIVAFKAEVTITDENGAAIPNLKDKLSLTCQNASNWRSSDTGPVSVGSDGKTYVLELNLEDTPMKNWETAEDTYIVLYDSKQEQNEQSGKDGYARHVHNLYVKSANVNDTGWTESDIDSVKIATKMYYALLETGPVEEHPFTAKFEISLNDSPAGTGSAACKLGLCYPIGAGKGSELSITKFEAKTDSAAISTKALSTIKFEKNGEYNYQAVVDWLSDSATLPKNGDKISFEISGTIDAKIEESFQAFLVDNTAEASSWKVLSDFVTIE